MKSVHSEPYSTIDSIGRVRHWPSVEERLWRRVDQSAGPDACWEWQGHRNPAGYGQIGIRHARLALAHRVAYEVTYGPIADGLAVCHACDNPPCCNPRHLWLGTYADNARDMAAKGRSARMRNERSGRAKLTDQQVAEIRDRRLAGEACERIALDYGIHPSHVSRVTRFQRRPADGRYSDSPPEVQP